MRYIRCNDKQDRTLPGDRWNSNRGVMLYVIALRRQSRQERCAESEGEATGTGTATADVDAAATGASAVEEGTSMMK